MTSGTSFSRRHFIAGTLAASAAAALGLSLIHIVAGTAPFGPGEGLALLAALCYSAAILVTARFLSLIHIFVDNGQGTVRIALPMFKDYLRERLG